MSLTSKTSMPKPQLHRNGIYYARLWVPTDLQAVLGKVEVTRSLRTRDPAEAKRRYRQVVAEVESEWENRRIAATFVQPADPVTPAPRTISEMEATALAGEFYRELVAKHGENPGTPAHWEGMLRSIQRSLPLYERINGLSPVPTKEGWTFHHSRNAFYALGQEVRAFLDRRNDNLDTEAFARLCVKVALAKRDAYEYLLRNAKGDYAPDPKAGRFPQAPQVSSPEASSPDDRSYDFEDVCAAWYKKTGVAAKTRKSWVGKFRMFSKFTGKVDLTTITQNDVLCWREHRQDVEKVSARTISFGDMAGPRAIYNWAMGTKLYPRIKLNPFADMSVKARKNKVIRDQGFTPEEAETILKATLEPVGKRFTEAGAGARRWAPWIGAYSGARIVEITQLHSDNVVEHTTPEGVHMWIMKLTPEDGTIKSSEFRRVPVHPHLIEQGFIDYVKRRKGKPLFYEPGRKRVADPANTQADKVGQRLAAWVRSLGIEGVAPNHGWRHRLKTNSRSYDLREDLGDYLTGHSSPGIAKTYGDYLNAALYREVCKMPPYLIDGLPAKVKVHRTPSATASE